MTPLQVLQSIRITGINEDGEYVIHFQKEDGDWAGLYVERATSKFIGKHIEQWEAARQAALNEQG